MSIRLWSQPRISELLTSIAVIAGLTFWSSVAVADDHGRIVGIVRYQSDPAQPWRYSRYYVSKAENSALAETLVCLRGRTLGGLRPPEKPGVHQVDQQDYRFIPETVAIRAGDQVRFTNSDAALHNVQSISGSEMLNVSLLQDGEFLYTFRRAGNSRKPIRIGCAFHSQMQAWVYVFDHPFFAVTAEDGRFAFDGIPAGDYTLEVIHPAGGLSRSLPVQVVGNDVVNLDVHLSPQDLAK